jgi:hypothetical protein
LVADELATTTDEDGGRLVKHSHYYWLLLAEGHLNRRGSERCWAGSRCYRYGRDSEMAAKAAEESFYCGVAERRSIANVGYNLGPFRGGLVRMAGPRECSR